MSAKCVLVFAKFVLETLKSVTPIETNKNKTEELIQAQGENCPNSETWESWKHPCYSIDSFGSSINAQNSFSLLFSGINDIT